jgi:hypothetical protein
MLQPHDPQRALSVSDCVSAHADVVGAYLLTPACLSSACKPKCWCQYRAGPHSSVLCLCAACARPARWLTPFVAIARPTLEPRCRQRHPVLAPCSHAASWPGSPQSSASNGLQAAWAVITATVLCGVAAFTAWAAQRHVDLATAAAEAGTVDLREVLRNARRNAIIIPFASAAVGARDASQLFLLLNQAVYQFVNLYLLMLFMRCAALQASGHCAVV